MKLYIIHHIKLFHCISCAKVLDINSGVIFNHFHLYTILSWRKNYTESYYTLLYTILSQRFLPNVSDISWMFIQHNVCNPKALKLCQIKGKKRYYPSFEWRNMTSPILQSVHLTHCDVLLVQKSFEPFEVILSMLLFDLTQQTIFPWNKWTKEHCWNTCLCERSACISITQSFMNCWLQQWPDTCSYKHPCTISSFIWFITQLISNQTVGTRLFTLLLWLASC